MHFWKFVNISVHKRIEYIDLLHLVFRACRQLQQFHSEFIQKRSICHQLVVEALAIPLHYIFSVRAVDETNLHDRKRKRSIYELMG